MKKSPENRGGTVRRCSSVRPSGAVKTAGSRKGKDREHPLPYTTASTVSRLRSVKDAEYLPKGRKPGFAVTAPRANWTMSPSDVKGGRREAAAPVGGARGAPGSHETAGRGKRQPGERPSAVRRAAGAGRITNLSGRRAWRRG